MNQLFGISHFDIKGVAAILLIFGIAEALIGAYRGSRRSLNDYLTELFSFSQLSALIQPGILLVAAMICHHLIPSYRYRYTGIALGWQFLFFILADDLPQYWWHRLAHRSPFVWRLHLAHHASPAMGFSTAFRNGALYYMLMPNIWIASIAVYMGFGQGYVLFFVVKLFIVVAAHSEVRWDNYLYSRRWLHPLAWVAEHTISTPATHFAHHGISDSDGMSNNNGNFGNMLFLWDILFGTAKLTRRYPENYGIENDPKDPWYVMLYYPIARSKHDKSLLK
jgi:sterol desaturase/sphingolipid hydroxylase (fatty acid hydroxylase superfamily)